MNVLYSPSQLGPLTQNADLKFDFHVSGTRYIQYPCPPALPYVYCALLMYALLRCIVLSSCRGALKVQLLFAREFLAVLADEQLQAGHVISVVPLLFTQGVNEKQNFTNKQELASCISPSPSTFPLISLSSPSLSPSSFTIPLLAGSTYRKILTCRTWIF